MDETKAHDSRFRAALQRLFPSRKPAGTSGMATPPPASQKPSSASSPASGQSRTGAPSLARALFDRLPAPCVLCRPHPSGEFGFEDADVLDMNAAFRRLAGQDLAREHDLSLTRLFGPAFRDHMPLFERVTASGRPESFELEQGNGRDVHWVTAFRPAPGLFACLFEDLAAERERNARIEYLGHHDSLTGLYNRAFCEEEIRRLDTARQYPLALIIGDMNGLKLINDVFGHTQGDEALCYIADCFRMACRTEDIIARWGGDEYLVLLPRTSAQDAATICARIRKACREGDAPLTRPGVALGYGAKTHEGQDIADVLRTAEQAMYEDKVRLARHQGGESLKSMLDALHESTRETEAHARRLHRLTQRIGQRMGLDAHELERLERLSLLHDIGKIAVPVEILNRDGPLSEEEWALVRRHPENGYRIVLASRETSPVADAVLTHHEHWDGNGYPQGLAGESIPLAARILEVVDAYDVMRHGMYQPPRSREEALAELKRCAGTQFDPAVVRMLADLLEGETE